jgi:hypothetical protein
MKHIIQNRTTATTLWLGVSAAYPCPLRTIGYNGDLHMVCKIISQIWNSILHSTEWHPGS